MKFLQDVPRWFLVLIILVVTGPLLAFSLNTHLEEDKRQSEDIRILTANVSRIAESIENLKYITENNREEHRWLHTSP